MSYRCKGICELHKANIPNKHMYDNGVRRCNTCHIFLTVNGVQFIMKLGQRERCRCCGSPVRKKARKSKKQEMEQL